MRRSDTVHEGEKIGQINYGQTLGSEGKRKRQKIRKERMFKEYAKPNDQKKLENGNP